MRSFMSFLPGGQSTTDKLVLQFLYIFIVSFPVWAGIKTNFSPNRKWNYKNYTSCRISLSVDSWPSKRKDMQLINKYWVLCPSSPEVSYQLTIVSYPVWAGIKSSIWCHVHTCIYCCLCMLHLITNKAKTTI